MKRLQSPKKFYVADFCEVNGSRFNLKSKTIILLLKFLELAKTIRICWHSPKGAFFIVIENSE